MIESLVAGEAVPSALNLLFLGSVGQLPVAVFAALALKWLAIRVDAALLALRTELAIDLSPVASSALLLPLPELAPVSTLAGSCPIVFTKRGPPAILRA